MNDGEEGTVECPSCRTHLTAGLRFCRHCGYRLGEGLEEYAETRRLGGSMPTGINPASQTASAAMGSHGPWGAMSHMPLMQPLEASKSSSSLCRRMAGSWVMWMVLVLAVLTAGGILTSGLRDLRRGERPLVAKSFPEVDGFKTGDGGGAFIEGLKTSDTSFERAGLLGGDIITSFDGKSVANARAMKRIFAATPVGKTVDVIFVRDGEVMNTKLKTVSERDFRDPLAERPGGRGFLGTEDMDRVPVPNTNTYGVQLNDVMRNGPGYIAGLRDGDIVVEFNGKRVRTTGDLRLRIYEALPDSIAKVIIMRGAERMEIPVKMGKR